MKYSRDLVSRWKSNPIVDAVVFTIVLAVIAVSAYMAHDTRIELLTQQEALKAAQELGDRKWRQFYRVNPTIIVPPKFFDRETIKEIEAENNTPPHNGNLYSNEPPGGWPSMDKAPQ